MVIKPNPDAQCIIIRDDVDVQKKQVEYLDTPTVTEMLNNPRLINRCLSKHYPDIRIKDDDRILRKKKWSTLTNVRLVEPRRFGINNNELTSSEIQTPTQYSTLPLLILKLVMCLFTSSPLTVLISFYKILVRRVVDG